ncbi:MAG: SpoIIE family protein phosphatase [Candidatus Eisenbacteria bacterium]|nr:SpoIIE family protein phosphatase [Candidatus Eisenbacteria bacterium]
MTPPGPARVPEDGCMQVIHRQDIGRKRERNEDALLIDEERGIFLLADGMGGCTGGEVASRVAVDTACAALRRNGAEDAAVSPARTRFMDAFAEAHAAVKAASEADERLASMGTTLVAVMITGGEAHIASVGDSRVYLMRDTLKQLTTDQTLGDYLVSRGTLTREQVPPRKWHVLTQAVGRSDGLAPAYLKVSLETGDRLLLCSDGLSGMLQDTQIEAALLETTAIEAAAEELIAAANANGGDDNISLILIRVP